MNVLLIAIGSHGDVHPFIGLGVELKKRGHHVTVLTNDYFEPLVRAAGLTFDPLATAEEFRSVMADPDLWHSRRGWKVVHERGVFPLIARTYDAVVRHFRASPNDTVIVTSTLAYGARIAQDKLNIPTVTVHLQPATLFSAYATPRLPGSPVPRWLPVWLKRRVFSAAGRLIVDPVLAPPINKVRAEHGLPPVSKIILKYWHSPTLTIGVFPEWFAPMQPDWPQQLKLTGFPLFDEKGLAPLSPALLQFLKDGPPPVAFTPGSAMQHGQSFFKESAEACRLAGLRGILLTRHRDQVPQKLPPDVIHIDYAPFSELLPHCAASVHHGGIGTTSQALAAGVPQLIMPMTHDQPDNAERIRKLGVGNEVSVKRYKGRRVARLLSEFVKSQDVKARCKAVADQMKSERPLERTCELIESQLGRRPADGEREPR